MPEPTDGCADGTPHPSRSSGPSPDEQARRVFLAGCGLPAAWAGQAQWRILETGFGRGLNFLLTWAAWRADPARPQRLHFVACAAPPVPANDMFHGTAADPALHALARQLQAQLWGLLPGVHRLAFEGGRVLLTLYIGDTQSMLRQQQPVADSVYLNGGGTAHPPETWPPHTLKAVARCCRRGTGLASLGMARALREGLAQCGFEVHETHDGSLRARFHPRWEPRPGHPVLPGVGVAAPGRCLVIGAGLAGAAVAASLARRGWQVHVLDRADAPAAGASGLAAGVFASHVSPDDSVLSRLSRAGVRTTLQALAQLPASTRDADWSDCGTLEHRVDGSTGLAWVDGPGLDWSQPATPQQLAANGLPADATACWHARGGWVRPPQLIRHLLDQPGIHWQGGAEVARLRRTEGTQAGWQALDGAGAVLAQAPLVVVCAGPHSMPLAQAPWALQALRGQIAWGLHDQAPANAPWPPQPLNGHGNLVPRVPLQGGLGWVLGSTFERDQTALPPSPAEQQAGLHANQAKLQALLPQLAEALAAAFAGAPAQPQGAIRTWAAVRCASPDRLPIAGPVDAERLPGLWVCTAMGARGLTLSLLCGELVAARLHAEPLPLDARLARALSTERL